MTGAVRKGWPATVRGSYRGCKFDAGQVLQRSAMLLDGHRLYFAFGSRQDIPDWHGWVAEVDVDHPQSPPAMFSPDPGADGGGIWGIGGVAVDAAGAIYAVTGNGEVDLAKGGHDVGQCALKLELDRNKLIFSEKPKDYYIPPNFAYLNSTDQDLGGSGEVLLPDLHGSSTPHLLVTAGKDGLVYLINRDNLGHLVQKMRIYGDPKQQYLAEIRATPAYFRDASGNGYVFVTGNDPGPSGCAGLTSLRITSNKYGPAKLVQKWTLPAPLAQPSSPEVSSDRTSDAIVWVTERFRDDHGGLDAFDASTGRKLYSTEEHRARDGYDRPLSFSCPTVADGRVFVGTGDGVVAYGLLPASAEGK